MRFRRIIEELDKDLQEIDQQFELEEKKSKKVKDQGHRSVEFKADNNPKVSKMDFLRRSPMRVTNFAWSFPLDIQIRHIKGVFLNEFPSRFNDIAH